MTREKKKNVRCFILCLVVLPLIVLTLCLFVYHMADKQDVRTKAVLGYMLTDSAPKPSSEKSDNKDLSWIIADSIEAATTDEAGNASIVSEITMVDCSTFIVTTGTSKTMYRLIGVASSGDKDSVEAYLKTLGKCTVTYDVAHVVGGVQQIYLWSGSPNDVHNLVNLKIVARGYAPTTYAGTLYAETPNSQYALNFMEAAKAWN